MTLPERREKPADQRTEEIAKVVRRCEPAAGGERQAAVGLHHGQHWRECEAADPHGDGEGGKGGGARYAACAV